MAYGIMVLMNRKNRGLLFAISVIFLFTGCWKKQKHEVTAPETPLYSVTGLVTDLNDGKPLNDVIVDLEPVSMLSAYDFSGASDTTAEDGQYSFADITPGQYQIRCLRRAFAVLDENLVVEHADKIYDIALPKPLVSRQSYGPPEFPSFRGICWKGPGILACVGRWNMVWVGNFETDFDLYGKSQYYNDNPPLYALTYLNRFWAYSEDGETLTINSIDPMRGNIDGRNVTEYKIRDMAADERYIWATTSAAKVVRFDGHPSIVGQIYDPGMPQPYGIAVDKDGFWIGDYEQSLIVKMDKTFQIEESYRPLVWRQGSGFFILNALFYIDIDSVGNLWVNDGTMIYKFEMDN
jgi:hypothetical protein